MHSRLTIVQVRVQVRNISNVFQNHLDSFGKHPDDFIKHVDVIKNRFRHFVKWSETIQKIISGRLENDLRWIAECRIKVQPVEKVGIGWKFDFEIVYLRKEKDIRRLCWIDLFKFCPAANITLNHEPGFNAMPYQALKRMGFCTDLL